MGMEPAIGMVVGRKLPPVMLQKTRSPRATSRATKVDQTTSENWPIGELFAGNSMTDRPRSMPTLFAFSSASIVHAGGMVGRSRHACQGKRSKYRNKSDIDKPPRPGNLNKYISSSVRQSP